MSNINEQVEELEISIEQARKSVTLMNHVYSLIDNKDFDEVVNKGYFEREASRLVLLRSDPNMQSAEDQAVLLKNIDAIGYFQMYLRTLLQIGRMARDSIAANEETISEILAEDLADG